MCEDDVQVCCLVTLSAAEKKILNTRGKPRREMLRQFSEVDLDGHGKCAVNVEEEDVRKYLLSNILIVSCSAHHSSELISSSLSSFAIFSPSHVKVEFADLGTEEVKDMFLSELSDGEFEEESWMCRKRCHRGYRLVAPCSCVRDYNDDDDDDAVGQSCQRGTDCGMC